MHKFVLSSAIALASLAMIAPMARANLLANESFDDDSIGALNGQTGGTGWNTQPVISFNPAPVGWQTQNAVAGYQVIAPGTALTYSTLLTGPNYAIGGQNFTTTGRLLDTSATGTFGTAGDLALPSNPTQIGHIGVSGKTVYMSLLMREDTNIGGGGMHVSLFTSGGTAWFENEGTAALTEVQIGDFGNGKWSLNVDGNNQIPSGTTTSSGVSVVLGQTYLMVLKLQFNGGGGADVASLWVDPASLGGADPGSPNTFGTGTYTLNALSYYGGVSGGNPPATNSSIDEIRFGDTWADVTPTTATAVPLPAAAWSGLSMLGCLAAFGLLRRRVAH